MKLLVINLFIINLLFSSTDTTSNNYNSSVQSGFGVMSVNIPDVVDYLNSKNASQRIEEFNALPEFFLSYNLNINNNYLVGLEYNYNLKYNSLQNSNDGINQINYYANTFVLNLSKTVYENYFNYNYGINIGVVSSSIYEHNGIYGIEKTYYTTGYLFGGNGTFKLLFDENLSSNIDVIIKYISTEKFKDSNMQLLKYSSNNVSFSHFGIGIRFGFSYKI